MIDLTGQVSRKTMNDYSGNREFSIGARAAADRMLAMIQGTPSLEKLRADLQAAELGFDSTGQAFWRGECVPLAFDRMKARALALALRNVTEPLAPVKK
jgi:hypothetical protein